MPDRSEARARRLWLPWRPRFRLVFVYPRYWHWVFVRLQRFDVWFSRRFRGRWYWPPLLAVVFVVFVAVRFLGFVAVVEVTIVAFAASIYLVWAEWILLLLLFPFVLPARLAHLLPWQLTAHGGRRRWTARVTGWRAGGQTAAAAARALAAGREPSGTTWTETTGRARVWM